jgi:hypothetical protein
MQPLYSKSLKDNDTQTLYYRDEISEQQRKPRKHLAHLQTQRKRRRKPMPEKTVKTSRHTKLGTNTNRNTGNSTGNRRQQDRISMQKLQNTTTQKRR